MRLGLILLLAGCDTRSDAVRYRDALLRDDWDAARTDCAGLSSNPARSDCLLAAMERHDRLDPADCALVADPLWHDECGFLFAERAARAGEIDVAFAACDSTAFRRECSYHLIREAARAVLDRPAPEAAARIAPYTALPGAPDAPRLFWRAWHRERLASHLPLDPDRCAGDTTCVAAARETLLVALSAMASARPDGLCDAELPTGTDRSGKVVWVASETTRAWVEHWVRTDCARRHDPDPAAGAGPG